MSTLKIPSGATHLSMSASEAMTVFDRAAPCPEAELRGWWSGREVHTGHPLDGALANVSWYGKRFDGTGQVHPLVVADRSGAPYPLNPNMVPYRLIAAPIPTPGWVKRAAPTLMTVMRRVASARNHGARLVMTEYRGVTTAAMVYDTRPIIDVFRKVDDHTVFGLMDYRGMRRPHFFVLHRDHPKTTEAPRSEGNDHV